jgi:hypothetical protein
LIQIKINENREILDFGWVFFSIEEIKRKESIRKEVLEGEV